MYGCWTCWKWKSKTIKFNTFSQLFAKYYKSLVKLTKGSTRFATLILLLKFLSINVTLVSYLETSMLLLDIRDLISLDDVQEELKLGPNGGLIYCMEYLIEHIDWLMEEL